MENSSAVTLFHPTLSHNKGRKQPAAGPTLLGQRIVALDVLRGFALLGILFLNIETFSGPAILHDVPMGTGKPAFVGWHAQLDLAIVTIKWMFFEGKMRTLFAILYGAGIVLLTERLDRRGPPGTALGIFCRRNLWLLVFGLLHGTLIWYGDILARYALIALLFMYPLRRLAARPLIILGLSIGILGGTFGVARTVHAPEVLAAERLRVEGQAALAAHRVPSPEQRAALDADARERSRLPAKTAESIREGRLPYVRSIAPRADTYLDSLMGYFRSGMFLEVAGSMLLGMGLYKTGFLAGARSRRRYVATAALGYAISMPIVLVGMAMAHAGGFTMAAATRWLYLPYTLEVVAGAIANASLLLLIIRNRWLAPVTSALGNVGRTAFSNYILTSLLCQFVFAWGPWKLYGALEYYQQVYVVVTVWALNLAASALWLRSFAYGPLEWVWRSLVYRKRQPMLRQQAA